MARLNPAATLAEFRIRFPEFGDGTRGASDTLVERMLVTADNLNDPDTWGDSKYDAVYYKAAHLVALSPYGADMRLKSDNGQTVYGAEYNRLLQTLTRGFVVP